MALLLCGLAAPVPAPALADGMIKSKAVDCYCTDKSGGRVELGETICLHVDARSFIAQCQMSLNNPMWREISEGCLSSALPQPPEPAVDARGVDAHV